MRDAQEPVVIGNQKQLFMDDHAVDPKAVKGLRRRVHQGSKYEGGSVLSATPPETHAVMRAGVIRNPQKNLFEMYYQSSFADLEHAVLHPLF